MVEQGHRGTFLLDCSKDTTIIANWRDDLDARAGLSMFTASYC
jgi:hypothetical protein